MTLFVWTVWPKVKSEHFEYFFCCTAKVKLDTLQNTGKWLSTFKGGGGGGGGKFDQLLRILAMVSYYLPIHSEDLDPTIKEI